jgi:hypothetical protein
MPSLLEPIRLGAIEAPNRIFMAPLTRGRATHDHVPTPIMVDYYSQRASAGLIITEATGIASKALVGRMRRESGVIGKSPHGNQSRRQCMQQAAASCRSFGTWDASCIRPFWTERSRYRLPQRPRRRMRIRMRDAGLTPRPEPSG